MVGVYGPRQSHRSAGYSDRGALDCDVKFANFATRRRTEAGQSAEEREASASLARALTGAVRLEAYPKASIDVGVTVLESGGDDLALAVAAASLALVDAGVEVLDTVAACSVCRVGPALLLNPSADEERLAEGTVTVALLPTLGKVSMLDCAGKWSQSAFDQAVDTAVAGCRTLDGAMRAALGPAGP